MRIYLQESIGWKKKNDPVFFPLIFFVFPELYMVHSAILSTENKVRNTITVSVKQMLLIDFTDWPQTKEQDKRNKTGS